MPAVSDFGPKGRPTIDRILPSAAAALGDEQFSNDLGLPVHDARTGGCCDGLQPDRVNANQGAESSLAFSLSLAEMHLAEEAMKQSLKCSA